MKAVIDSDMLIDFLQGIDAAAAEIDRVDDARYSGNSIGENLFFPASGS